MTKALGGPLVDAAAREIAQGAVLERVLDEVLATEVLDHIVDRAEQAGAVHRLADRVLADGIVERAAERFLSGPEFERLVVLTLDSPGIERAVASLFESRLLDQVVARLLSGPELWRLVDEVARSPAVTEAITAPELRLRRPGRRRGPRPLAHRRRGGRAHDPPAAAPAAADGSADRAAAESGRPVSEDYAGFVTRAIAFAIDVALIDLAAAIVAIVVGLGISALRRARRRRHAPVAIGGVAYLLWFVAYFATFWSTTGQTPGARVMGVRVVCARGGEPVRAARRRRAARRGWCWPRSRSSPASC